MFAGGDLQELTWMRSADVLWPASQAACATRCSCRLWNPPWYSSAPTMDVHASSCRPPPHQAQWTWTAHSEGIATAALRRPVDHLASPWRAHCLDAQHDCRPGEAPRIDAREQGENTAHHAFGCEIVHTALPQPAYRHHYHGAAKPDGGLGGAASCLKIGTHGKPEPPFG